MDIKSFLHINVFGSKVGVLILFEDADKKAILTIFKYDGKKSFELVSKSSDLKKSKIESLHTVIINYISLDNSIRVFQKEDQVEMSLLKKLSDNHTYTNYIDLNERIVVTSLSTSILNVLKSEKRKLIKDHHFEGANFIGLEILKYKMPQLWSTVETNIESEENIVIDNETYDKISLNSLGLLAGHLLFDSVMSSHKLINETNIIKSFTKRILFKVVPIVLVVLVANYFYIESLNKELFETQQQIKSVQNILGYQELKSEKSNQELVYINSLYYPTSLDRPYIINSVIEAHINGIVYQSLTIDPRPKDAKDIYEYGEVILKFSTKDTSLLANWIEQLNSIDIIESVSLKDLDKNYKGLSEGQLNMSYKL